jgi:hemin uptake protein HemP
MSRKTETTPSAYQNAEPEMALAGTERRSGPTRYRVSDLMGGEREVILEHRGQDYRLRITEAGKLILSK